MLRVPGVLLCLVGLLLGCREPQATRAPATAPVEPKTKASPVTPLAQKAGELGEDVAWNPGYDAFLEQNLPADLLSTGVAPQVRAMCPSYVALPEADRRAFWAYTFQALAAAEAGLKPTADVRHTAAAVDVRDTVTHRLSRQEGLMQVKYEDASRYGCDFDPRADARLPERSAARTILQPQRNLLCGLKIMENQIVTEGKPLVSRSSYWATLQPGTRGYRVFARQMVNVPTVCGVHGDRRAPAGRGKSRMAAGE